MNSKNENQAAARQQPEQQSSAFARWVSDNHAGQPSLMSELKAMAREAIKDIRQTMNQVFFGQHEHAPEPGTPLNPTPQVVTADGYGAANDNGQGYRDQLNQTAARASQDNDRGRGMSR
jgi:hypothetical protein